MKKLAELITGLKYELKYGDENVDISSLVYAIGDIVLIVEPL